MSSAWGPPHGADHAGQDDEEYAYDANGNRTDPGIVVGANNRLLEDAIWAYDYDAEGNTISQTRKSSETADDHVIEFGWDHRGRLIEVVQKHNSGDVTTRVEYDYDVFERMIGRREYVGTSSIPSLSEHFVWDGANIALILNDTGAVTERRFNGNAVDAVFASESATNDVTWILADHLGTPRDFIDSSGTVTNHRRLNTFGEFISETDSSVGANLGLTGGYRDRVTGFILRGIRWYNPRTHRWQSEDRIWDGANLNAYVGNNPVSRRDPTGLAPNLTLPEDNRHKILPPNTAFTIAADSAIVITDVTVASDYHGFLNLHVAGALIQPNVSSWEQIGNALDLYSDGSLDMIVLSGHGGIGRGVLSSTGYLNYQSLHDEYPDIAETIRAKLRADGKFVFMSCGCGHKFDYSQTQAMADYLGVRVIAVDGAVTHSSMGVVGQRTDYGDGTWYQYDPHPKKVRK